MNPSSGTAPSIVTVSINISGLSAGTYTGTVTVIAAGASGSPKTVSVTLNVNPQTPVLLVDPTSLSFSATEGGSNPSGKTFEVTNGGGGTLNWSASDNAGWLSVNPSSGTAPSTVTVSINISGLSAGTYTGTVTVIAAGASGSPKTVSVALEVKISSDVVVSIPDTIGQSGTDVDIPIRVTDVTGKGIYSFGIKLTYDSGVLDATGATSTGGITSSWGLPTANYSNSGEVVIGMAGSSPLTGSGVLVFVHFHVKGSAGSSTTIRFAEATFNEGSPIAGTEDGDFTVTDVQDVPNDLIKQSDYHLSQNYPNPFNSSTIFHYLLPKRSEVCLDVYDINGKKVISLVSCIQTEGKYEIQWFGLNDRGEAVSSGVYFYRLKAGKFLQINKLILIR